MKNGRNHAFLPTFFDGPRSLLLSLFLFFFSVYYTTAAFSVTGLAIIVVFSAVTISYIVYYASAPQKNGPGARAMSKAFAAVSILLFAASTLLYLNLGPQFVVSFVELLIHITTYFVIMIPLFFLISAYSYLKVPKARLVVMAVILLVVVAYFVKIFLYTYDDELMISYTAAKNILNGIDPYSVSIAAQLYGYQQSPQHLGLTLTSSNAIVGSADYPALYFLVQAPFYVITLLLHPAASVVSFINLQAFAFFFIFILAYLRVIRKQGNSLKPNFIAYLFMSFLLINLSSMVVFLMMALVMVLYSDIGERYSWLFLGLMASLQEQLWIIVLLFIVYSFNNYGARRGLRDLLGSVLVFLFINGIFIAAGPSEYVNSIMLVASGILPSNSAVMGYAISSMYAISFNAFTYLFVLSVLLVAVATLYARDKRPILLLSIIPFFFMNHGLNLYYLLPVTVFSFVAALDTDPKGGARNRLRALCERNGNARHAFYALIIAITAAMLYVIYSAHSSYLSAINLSIKNQSIFSAGPGNLTYSAVLTYVPQSNATVYLALQVSSQSEVAFYGIFNQSIINGSLNCRYPSQCSINVNKITLNESGSYDIRATIPSNQPLPLYVSAILYNSKYYYRSIPIKYG